jgi:hypothetical protein
LDPKAFPVYILCPVTIPQAADIKSKFAALSQDGNWPWVNSHRGDIALVPAKVHEYHANNHITGLLALFDSWSSNPDAPDPPGHFAAISSVKSSWYKPHKVRLYAPGTRIYWAVRIVKGHVTMTDQKGTPRISRDENREWIGYEYNLMRFDDRGETDFRFYVENPRAQSYIWRDVNQDLITEKGLYDDRDLGAEFLERKQEKAATRASGAMNKVTELPDRTEV